jgi:hypothetical protein
MKQAIGWVMLAGVLGAAVPASAQEDPGLRDAQARFQEGVARVRAGKLEEALLSFKMALAVAHKPVILWNLALVEEKTHRNVDALGHFREYLHDAPSDDPDRERAQKHIDALSAQVAHIDVSTVAGARLAVDGTAAGTAPLKDGLDVMPGHHIVEARLGAFAKSVELDLRAGQRLEASLQETDSRSTAGAAPAPATGATAPMGTPEGAPPVQPTPAPERPVDAPSSGPSLAKIITVAGLGGTALLGVGLGAVYALRSQNDANDAATLRQGQSDSSCQGSNSQRCASLASAVQSQSTDKGLATGFYITGGVLAAGAIATWFLWPRPQSAPAASAPPTAKATVIPSAGPNSAGLSLVGSF